MVFNELGQIDELLSCPICHEMITNAVILSCGHSCTKLQLKLHTLINSKFALSVSGAIFLSSLNVLSAERYLLSLNTCFL